MSSHRLWKSREYLDVLVADAVGHGIAAALVMAETRAYVRALALSCTDLGRLLSLTNRRLADELVSGNFVTVLLMRVEPQTRSLCYSSPGTGPPMCSIVREISELRSPAREFPLGSIRATNMLRALRPSLSRVIWCSCYGRDRGGGIPGGEPVGLERTLGTVGHHRHESAQEVLDVLFRAIGAFAENNHQDDLTAVVIQVDQSQARTASRNRYKAVRTAMARGNLTHSKREEST